MDVHNPKQRSYNMSRIRDRDTKPELLIRKWLWGNGYRYRLHTSRLSCKPDIIFPGRKKCIFINGCFWHKHNCKYFKWPKTNVEFWKSKIEGNVLRDQKNYDSISLFGWKYLIIWECEIKHPDKHKLWDIICDFLH